MDDVFDGKNIENLVKFIITPLPTALQAEGKAG